MRCSSIVASPWQRRALIPWPAGCFDGLSKNSQKSSRAGILPPLPCGSLAPVMAVMRR